MYVRGNIDALIYFQEHPFQITEGEHARLDVYRCPSCGHGFTPLTFDPSLIDRWYAEAPEDQNYLQGEKGRKQTAYRVLKRIHRWKPQRGILLDIGPGPGFFLECAHKKGWDVQGVEPSLWGYRRLVQSLGANRIQHGTFDLLSKMSAQSIDVITAFDVMEHLPYPDRFLKEVSRVLRADGILVMTLPRFDSLLSRMMRQRWHCIFPAHLHYFTRDSLLHSLRQHGFTMQRALHHTRNFRAAYLRRRLAGLLRWPSLISLPLPDITVPVNLQDEWEVYVRKNTGVME
jgi:SAM-dependent methyltransferase